MTNLTPGLQGPLVVALLYNRLCTFEFGIVAEIFGLPRPEMGAGWYRFASCPIEEGPLRAHGGLLITPDGSSDLIDEADIIIVPGWKGADIPVPEAVSERLRGAHRRGARLASICSGAFVLAATGLLDGGTATTHWRHAEALRKRHPEIDVDDASLYREHDRIFTSAGSAAGMDLLIEIVRQDFGALAANSVARRLVMPAHRTGGQAQFLERPVTRREGTAISPVLDRMRASLAAEWTIERMAAECRMSPRTFLRRFAEATGATPGDWLTMERVAAAKELLSQGEASIDGIAASVGFGSAHTLRHHFRQKIGISPAEYRRRFLVETVIQPI
ncbi:transcriptional regulator FtrA [Brucella intermedia]|uniref:transcriptional regulator FtrA n=1 Tax=Brucella intermedia TaxID=94625 RepID=UPI0004692584|nr:transcriptional regulator FtrA [Brucella intermedia]UXO82599.1 transcriptional regulator FtrA [Brucella intermedia]WGJ06212.1 transcriptional regulator FtrA [Brucella intermedia]